MNVRTHEVAGDETGLRLDRWFRRHFPDVPHGRLEKLLRTGQVRVDGARAKANLRLAEGQAIRVPPLGERAAPVRTRTPQVPAAADVRALQAAVLHRDDALIVLDKPPGLAVQGGTKTHRHIDAMLDALRFGAAERPRLVHRLDKDTSGVLVLARTAAAARALTAAFRRKEVKKLYWALVVGAPKPAAGSIELALAKRGSPGGEKVVAAEDGKRAVTLYRTLETWGGRLSWLALSPLTGRTHQLRAHCASFGIPILGDGKYGGRSAFPEGSGLARGLHLHARAISVPHPGGGSLRIEAPPPAHMVETFAFLGFDPLRTGARADEALEDQPRPR